MEIQSAGRDIAIISFELCPHPEFTETALQEHIGHNTAAQAGNAILLQIL